MTFLEWFSQIRLVNPGEVATSTDSQANFEVWNWAPQNSISRGSGLIKEPSLEADGGDSTPFCGLLAL